MTPALCVPCSLVKVEGSCWLDEAGVVTQGEMRGYLEATKYPGGREGTWSRALERGIDLPVSEMKNLLSHSSGESIQL